jgi:hypothetical protein
MNLRHISTAAAALLLAATVQAHDCSGGTDGGMDATGNQCNDPASVVAGAPFAAPAKPTVQAARPAAAAVRPARTGARAPNRSERLVRAATAQGR